MKREEFLQKFIKLCNYYNSEIYKDEKITIMYYEKVKDLSVEEFSNLCRDIINNNKFMPKIAEFNNSKRGYAGRYYTDDFLESLYDNL